MFEDLKRRIKKYSMRFRHKKSKQLLFQIPKVRFSPFLSEIEDQSFETEIISSSRLQPQSYDEEIALDLDEIDSQLNSILQSPWNYNGKCSLYFQRQLNQQYKDLIIRKEQLREQFGQIETEYEHMTIEMPHENSKTQSTTSNYYSEKRQYNLINSNTHQKIRLTFIDQDFDKLLPGNDLNDTLIQNYLQILNTFMLPAQENKSSYIFSTYLIEKLLKEMLANNENDASYFYSEQAVSSARRSVCENYGRVQRWTRKQDLFGYEVLVFPINMFVHWFCVLVLNPRSLLNPSQDSSQTCQIIFCDSMFQQRNFVVEAIRTYLELELLDKKKINIRIDSFNAPSYQLLLPRQTNTHDCGLYMLAYIEELLINRSRHLEGLTDICNRLQLRLFPRIYLESFRHRMMNLLVKLYKEQAPHRTEAIIDEYLAYRSSLFAASNKTDSESMEAKQFQKFIALIRPNNGVELSAQDQFALLVKFNLICEINYYQFDSVKQPQEREQTDSDFM